eukprot:CAMPEP_0171909992 /NCGR_PEP_ID=MMETSP0993-20121228/9079_1 /TAXON_ID=483369 /ORGANISM="non described non described, Strain CCMP2098" /LENGTH=271 /DNA_ID=CAMNT_0012543053 /DNA_START=19 /DNA_END=834 /DNA_ORIENTATION=-
MPIEHSAKPIGEGQEACLMIAHALCPVVLGLTIWWVKSADTAALFLGGLGWSTNSPPIYVFNWHPLLMVTGVVAETQAILAYRTWPVSRNMNKLIHLFWHCAAVVCFSVGMKAVWRYKNLKDYADLYSLHSWVGIAVAAMVFAQFLTGFAVYVFPTLGPLWRKAYLPLHGFAGVFIYAGLCLSVTLGVTNKTTIQGCGYKSYSGDKEDLNPAEYYKEIYLGCRVSYGLGVCVVLLCITALYAVMDLKSAGPAPKKVEKHTEDDDEEGNGTL